MCVTYKPKCRREEAIFYVFAVIIFFDRSGWKKSFSKWRHHDDQFVQFATTVATSITILCKMSFLHLFIVNKSGGLIHHRPLSSKGNQNKIGTNEWLRIASTFHSLYAIAAEASPVRLPNNKNYGTCVFMCVCVCWDGDGDVPVHGEISDRTIGNHVTKIISRSHFSANINIIIYIYIYDVM